jgi:hypothetical protein
MDRACCDGQGVGFIRFGGAAGTSLVWLTSTSGLYERDPVMARLPNVGGAERYLVGWRTINDNRHHLAIVDGEGILVEGPETVAGGGISWGDRDDSFRTRPDGSVSWLHGAANSSSLTLYRYSSATIFSDGFESGTPAAWSASAP